MTVHLAAILVAAIVAVSAYVFLFKSLNEIFALQHEINAKLPLGRKFEPLFWSWGTREKLRRLQIELLPESQRLKRSRRFGLLFFLLFLLAITILGVGMRRFP